MTMPIEADRISLQLYTVRGLMERDLDGTLSAIAGIGYRRVEAAGTHGRTAREFRDALDRHGLWASSGHIAYDQLVTDSAAVLDDMAILGSQFVVCPWLPDALRTIDGVKRVAATLNLVGEQARTLGIRLGYHNHEFEFASCDGVALYDLLAAETDADKVHFELDIYWTERSGANSGKIIDEYQERILQIHAKDMGRDGGFADLGMGEIDYQRLLDRTTRAAVVEYIVEHDASPDPIGTARTGWGYLIRQGETERPGPGDQGSQAGGLPKREHE